MKNLSLRRIDQTPPGPWIPIVNPVTNVGRSHECHIGTEDTSASRQHFRVLWAGGVAQLLDLQSRNGTYLNGHKIGGTETLADGDEIRAANTIFEVSLTDEGPADRDPLNQTLTIGVTGEVEDPSLPGGDASQSIVPAAPPPDADPGASQSVVGLQLPGPDDSLVSQPPGGQTSSGGFSFKSLFGLRGRKPKA